MRRRWRAPAAAATALVSVLAACSSDTTTAPAPAPAPDCPAAAHPWQLGPGVANESGDGLPTSGTATRAAADAALSADRAALAARFGAVDLAVRVDEGRAWKPSGTIVDEGIATIVLTIAAESQCPTRPQIWNGIPLTFAVRGQ